MSLLTTQADHYRDSRFAEVWADVKRTTPESPRTPYGDSGAATVEARIVKDVRVEWLRSELSVTGRIVSVPSGRQPQLNRLHLERGRWLDPLRRDEILVNAGFAEAWSIAPDDPISVILNGRIQTFRVAGIAHSPEFVYASRPGNPLPDDRTLVVLWADEDAVARPSTCRARSTTDGLTRPRRIDALRHRGARSPPRALWRARRLRAQGPAFPSILSDELAEQRTLAIAVPMVFFAVAAFLLNVVLGRLVERSASRSRPSRRSAFRLFRSVSTTFSSSPRSAPSAPSRGSVWAYGTATE